MEFLKSRTFLFILLGVSFARFVWFIFVNDSYYPTDFSWISGDPLILLRIIVLFQVFTFGFLAATHGNRKWGAIGLKTGFTLVFAPIFIDAFITTVLVIESAPNFFIKIPESILAILIPIIHFFAPYGELGTYNDLVFGFFTSVIFYGLLALQFIGRKDALVGQELDSKTRNNEKGTTSMALKDSTWTVRIPGQPEEPVSTMVLQNWVKSGFVKADTMVTEVATGYTYQARQIPGVFSSKSYVTALLLSFFFGVFGVDRFYLGHVGVGLGKLFTFGGLGIWALIDFILIATKNVKDSQGVPLA
jgi:hypothetical protein